MTTLEAIEQAVIDNAEKGGRPHLGASIIGESCERKLWYGFRWATKSDHSPRILRLFQRGHREEETFINLLRSAGVRVVDRNKDGKQFTFAAVGGHFGGSLDAMLKGLKESDEWHVAEFKTSGDKAFKELIANGVEKAKPLHYAQMQCYMHWSNTKFAYYMAVNKNDDQIHAERITYNPEVAEHLFKKAERIISRDRPPVGISDSGAYYECKWCDHKGTCHDKKVAEVNCRTCIHATPEVDGQGRWSCRKQNCDIDTAQQEKGCDQHRFIPDLVPFAEAIKSDSNGETITYQMPDGSVLHNGPKGVCSYPSTELALLNEKNASDKNLDYLRNQFNGWVTRSETK
jgi:hypothetical protein